MPRIAAVGSSDAAVANSNHVASEDGDRSEGGGGGGGRVGQVPFHKPGTKSARGAAAGVRGRGRGGSSSRGRGGASQGGGGGGKRQDPLKGGFKFGKK